MIITVETRTIEAQNVQKLKNNESRPKFTGSYMSRVCQYIFLLLLYVILLDFCALSSKDKIASEVQIGSHLKQLYEREGTVDSNRGAAL